MIASSAYYKALLVECGKPFDGQDYVGILEIPALEMKLPVHQRVELSKAADCAMPLRRICLYIRSDNNASHFGALNALDEVAIVIFTDMEGNSFQYNVVLKEMLEAHEVEIMKNSEWDLTLFTCTPGGTYRVTIRCMFNQDAAYTGMGMK